MSVIHHIASFTSAGAPVDWFRITNRTGAYVELTNWGARWMAAYVSDANGQWGNVLVAPQGAEQCLADTYYMGALIGRMANRIANATCVINGTTYTLEANDGVNTNHGGTEGFDKQLWHWTMLPDGVNFTHISPDGAGGYPGNVSTSITYQWNEANELSIHYRATTDRTTYLNLTNHAYFNLSAQRQCIDAHTLHLPAHYVLETTEAFIPTGRKVAVAGTPFDFTVPTPIGRHLHTSHQQLQWNRGYNHCYLLKETRTPELLRAARLCDPHSGRSLEVDTDLPAVLLYTAGYYKEPHTAVCLETQFYPDTPSHPHFPSCLLQPGEEYRQQTVYRFGINRTKSDETVRSNPSL